MVSDMHLVDIEEQENFEERYKISALLTYRSLLAWKRQQSTYWITECNVWPSDTVQSQNGRPDYLICATIMHNNVSTNM